VEIIDTFKIKEDDIRYGLFDEEEDRDKFKYNTEALLKKKDLINKGKINMLLNKVNLLDLANKMNYCTQLTPNGRIMLKIRCISFKFELAEWLEKNAERMRKIFYEDSVKNALVLKQFLKELEE
jgi:hypothetical protein